MLDCLRLKTVEELLQADNDEVNAFKNAWILSSFQTAKWAQTASTFRSWGPRIDNILFPDKLEKLAEGAPKRPIIIGVTSDEQIFFCMCASI